MTRGKKILVINPNSNQQVTRHLAEALKPLMFENSPEIECVTLAEGPTMMTNIVDCDFDALRVGQPVNVVFKDTENGPPVPMFKPA